MNTGTCRLCLQKGVELKNSHIIPEFFYKRIYDAKGRFQVFAEHQERPGRFEQKGFREYLLCGSCEGKFSVLEKYVKELLYDKAPAGIDREDRMDYPGLHYAKLKLFQMSILWRMNISTIEGFSGVSLGHRHSERLRRMLQQSDPGEVYDYGCWLCHVALRIPEYSSIIIPPTQSPVKVGGHFCYRVGLGGILWCFYVSGHMDQFPLMDLFLTKSGTLGIWKETPLARQFVREMTESATKTFG